MIVEYQNFGGVHPFEKETQANSFMLMNKKGGYIFLGDYERSRFQGVYSYDGKTMLKLIDWIGNHDKIKKIIHKKWCCEKIFEDNHSERIIFPYGMEGFYFITENESFEIDLDVKESYDSREFGRFYYAEKQKDMIIIEFIKKTSKEEDKDRKEGEEEKRFYIIVHGKNLRFEQKEEWIKKEYSYDKRRGTNPSTRYVFRPGKFFCKNAVVCYGENRKQVIKESINMMRKQERIIRKHNKEVQHYVSSVVKEKEHRTAYENAEMALNGLIFGEGIFAGLPWFFQQWSRDELISLGGIKSRELKIKILTKYIDNILPNGRLPNILDGKGLGSADSIGWLFLRAEDIINSLNKKEREYFIERLHHSLSLTDKYSAGDGLVYNSEQETWMDTLFDGDSRAGNRIEIQAMRLRMYQMMSQYFSKYNDKEKELKRKVLREFYNGKYLKDGKEDDTIRPNVFIAAYFYPELLTKKQWSICFKEILKELWLDWGGLSTINKKNKLFCPAHTGEDNKSYHRGDSWFWINNIAAIVMARIDFKGYSSYINKILAASTQEILYNECIGCASEISSAEKMESFGCYNQAWSNSTYIELIEELSRREVI